MLSIRLIILVGLVPVLTKCLVFDSLSRNSGRYVVNSSEISEDPLFLTEYIEEGYIETAKRFSRCGDLPNAPPLESYSGFITVRKKYNSNIFFWFFPAVNENPDAPVLLWLQGGPGQSGLYGLFTEHGPYRIQANLTAVIREHHWARTFHMIYVDNPVGAGYSFTEDERGYVTNQDEMAEDMYEFLRQFFILFQEYKNNDFYIAGESYGGKYAPCLAHKIHSMGTSAVVKLTGISIGNGFCDPKSVIEYYNEFMYSVGLIDEQQAIITKKLTDKMLEEIKKGNYSEDLFYLWNDIFDHYEEYSGSGYFYNFVVEEEPEDFSYYLDYVTLPQFKKALKLGNKLYQDAAYEPLLLDIFKSVAPNITVIMNNYKVLIYHGQLDSQIPYPAIQPFLKTVEWKYSAEYKTAERKIWHLKGSEEIAGYVHNVGDFYEVLVRNAGHTLAHDQPEFAFDLISRFVNNEPFS